MYTGGAMQYAYSTPTGEPVIVKYNGAVQEGFTLTAPVTLYDK